MIEPRVELFDHTADVGIRIVAPTHEGMVACVPSGLYAAIGTVLPGRESSYLEMDFSAGEFAVLLRDFMAELLHLFETEGKMVTEVKPGIVGDGQLSVQVRVTDVDKSASDISREVKAVTYHDLECREIEGGFQVEFIVDI
ncbi:MAG: archease [Planctomycetota bacterium]|jgi:SHS2 domain-containing protein